MVLIGEALAQLAKREVELFEQIVQARQIISCRNKLTREYVAINDQFVLGVIHRNLPALLCTAPRFSSISMENNDHLRRAGKTRVCRDHGCGWRGR
ncbi:MAG: HepT-like ribonuclease domain-containing protein, partial [bacterium]